MLLFPDVSALNMLYCLPVVVDEDVALLQIHRTPNSTTSPSSQSS